MIPFLLSVALALAPASGGARGRRVATAASPDSPAAKVSMLIALPPVIGFSATDPDQPGVAGNSTATITWQLQGGSPQRNWNLKIQAAGGGFDNCGNVPASAVTVSCQKVLPDAGGAVQTCSAPFPLSTGAQQLAGGMEVPATHLYTVLVNFSFADKWKYVSKGNSQCTLSLIYTIDAP